MRETEGETEQSNPDGTNHSLKSPWGAGGCYPTFCAEA